jgi:alkanesulfonate monooxygenase SsuD/methylene tetrahydromethanopterin reductase-like flavin-dependent oxidoreductase (luciferase family)
LKFGIYLPNFGPYGDARVLANLALDAENAGWDGFFIRDHISSEYLESGIGSAGHINCYKMTGEPRWDPRERSEQSASPVNSGSTGGFPDLLSRGVG